MATSDNLSAQKYAANAAVSAAEAKSYADYTRLAEDFSKQAKASASEAKLSEESAADSAIKSENARDIAISQTVRTLRVPDGETLSVLPSADNRKGKFPGFDSVTGDVKLIDISSTDATGLALSLASEGGGELVGTTNGTVEERFNSVESALSDKASIDSLSEKISGAITFAGGGVLNSEKDFIYNNEDLSWYYWSGSYGGTGKVVLPDSTPEGTGGVGPRKWLNIGDSSLRRDLSAYFSNRSLFLATFFKSSSDPSVNIMTSEDGLVFSDPVKLKSDAYGTMQGRDPSIAYLNGVWLIAITSNIAGSRDFGLYSSKNLTDWEFTGCTLGDSAVLSDTTPLPGGTVPASAVWAPELVVDNGELYVFVSIRYYQDEVDSTGALIRNFRTFYSKCTDAENFKFTSPVRVLIQDGNKIDPSILLSSSGMYYMSIKNEYEKGIEIYKSNAITGAYEFVSEISGISDVEGPSMVEIHGSKFRIYFDTYKTLQGIFYVDTSDFVSYTQAKPIFANNFRHGSVIYSDLTPSQSYDVAFCMNSSYSIETAPRVPQYILYDTNGTYDLTPSDNDVYAVSGNASVTLNLSRGSNRAKFCVRSNSNTAGIILTGATQILWTLGFGKDKNAIIEVEWDNPTQKYRLINKVNNTILAGLVTAAGSSNINNGAVTWYPDHGATYTTSGSDSGTISIYRLPSEPVSGFYFNVCINSSNANGAIAFKNGGNINTPNSADILLSGVNPGITARLIRVEKCGSIWIVQAV